jgi:cellulose synthase/poly-beta-1,6-N-acetylglucosamine synthase-like glycosyltransferase
MLAAAVALALLHFGTPLAYYAYLKAKWLGRPWNVRRDPGYKPKVTVIVPTYNEAEFILKKLDDIYSQDYPRNLVEVIVIDSASTDGTPQLVKKWVSEHEDANLKLVVEPERRGKLYAVLEALKHVPAESDIVVLTDADAFWEPSALSKAVAYFADPSVGAVTASIFYSDSRTRENAYRSYYNKIRVCESKIHSTPVHNGPFLAIRAELIRKYGLPEFPGSDDSSFGSYIAFLGYRAIQVDDVVVKEPVRGSEFRRKIRRAQHLTLNFLKTRKYAKRRGVYRNVKQFEKIWRMEWWLHIVNPWLLLLSVILLTAAAFKGLLIAAVMPVLGIALLIFKPYRVWITQQIYLLLALLRNPWTTEATWEK